jgi:hypothetical protein
MYEHCSSSNIKTDAKANATRHYTTLQSDTQSCNRKADTNPNTDSTHHCAVQHSTRELHTTLHKAKVNIRTTQAYVKLHNSTQHRIMPHNTTLHNSTTANRQQQQHQRQHQTHQPQSFCVFVFTVGYSTPSVTQHRRLLNTVGYSTPSVTQHCRLLNIVGYSTSSVTPHRR